MYLNCFETGALGDAVSISDTDDDDSDDRRRKPQAVTSEQEVDSVTSKLFTTTKSSRKTKSIRTTKSFRTITSSRITNSSRTTKSSRLVTTKSSRINMNTSTTRSSTSIQSSNSTRSSFPIKSSSAKVSRSNCEYTKSSTPSNYSTVLKANATLLEEIRFRQAVNLIYNKTYPGYSNCTLYAKHLDLNYKICSNFFHAKQSATDNAVTLVTQLTFNRFGSFKRLASKWRGPISVAFYVTSSELRQNVSQIKQWIASKNRLDIAVHFMIKRGVSGYSIPDDER